MNVIYKRLVTIVALIVGTLCLGTAGFVLIENYPVFDALYMSVITITTVGYFEVHSLSRAGRAFNIFLLLFGVSVMFYAVGAVTQTALETQFSDLFNKRRIRKMIDQLNNHFIVCGYGRVGRAAAAELRRTGVPFVIVDRSDDKVEWAIRDGYLAVMADSTRDETLVDAGIHRAKGLVAALSTDADNLFLILSAKGLNPRLRVASRVSEEGSEPKLRRAGADAVFMPYSVTGYRLAQSILRPHVFEFLDITTATSGMGINIGIEQVEIHAESPLAGRSLAELQIRRDLGVIVLAIRRESGQMVFNPPAAEAVEAGDVLIVMGGSEDVRKLETMVTKG